MTEQTKFDLRWWLYGLVAFAVVIATGSILLTGSPFGITDHQAAATAERVNEIHASWREGGVRNIAIAAMIGDLIFIGIYSWGSYRAGRSIAEAASGTSRLIGTAVWIAAIVFLVTDYLETVLQVIQLTREQGVDWMAQTAATVRQPKIIAWIVTFLGVIAALLIRRFGRP